MNRGTKSRCASPRQMSPHTLLGLVTFLAVAFLAYHVHGAEEVSSSTSATNISDTDGVNASQLVCEPGWEQHMRRCFIFNHHGLDNGHPYTFDEAREECQELYDGDLISIEDEETQKFLVPILKELGSNVTWLAAKLKKDHDHHADAAENHDDDEHHHWIVSGNLFNYTNWARNGQAGVNETRKCVTISSAGTWSVADCDSKTVLFCEKDLEKPRDKSKNVLWVLAYALLGLIFVALLIGCCIFCLLRRKNEATRASGGGKFSGIYYKRSSARKAANGSEY